MEKIYHITTKPAWESIKIVGKYTPEGFAKEGFIHFSFADQVAGTAARYYEDVPDLIVLVVDQEKLRAEVRVEQAPNGSSYPHLYGELNLDAVIDVVPLPGSSNGIFIFNAA